MRKIANRIHSFLTADQSSEETYLNESTSLIDLEYRQQQIDRGLFRGRTQLTGLASEASRTYLSATC